MNAVLRLIDGKWFVDHSYPKSDEPRILTIRWRAIGMRRRAPYGLAPEPTEGLAVTWVRDSDSFQAYAQGGYLIVDCEHEGTISESEIPAPRVRKGTELRYHDGRWAKYLKTQGWVAA